MKKMLNHQIFSKIVKEENSKKHQKKVSSESSESSESEKIQQNRGRPRTKITSKKMK